MVLSALHPAGTYTNVSPPVHPRTNTLLARHGMRVHETKKIHNGLNFHEKQCAKSSGALFGISDACGRRGSCEQRTPRADSRFAHPSSCHASVAAALELHGTVGSHSTTWRLCGHVCDPICAQWNGLRPAGTHVHRWRAIRFRRVSRLLCRSSASSTGQLHSALGGYSPSRFVRDKLLDTVRAQRVLVQSTNPHLQRWSFVWSRRAPGVLCRSTSIAVDHHRVVGNLLLASNLGFLRCATKAVGSCGRSHLAKLYGVGCSAL
jgi:hypothetical protein